MWGRAPITSISCIFLALVLFAVSLGCDYSETRRKRLRSSLIDLKSQRTVLLDELYRDYGGGSLVRSLQESSEGRPTDEPEGEGDFVGFLKGVIEEGDRALFEEQIRVVGRGDRPVTPSPRDRDFFAREPVRSKCRRVVELDYEIEEVQEKLDELEQAASEAPS